MKLEIGAAVRPGDGKGKTALVRGRDVGRGMPGEIELTQAQVADALSEPVNQIVEVVRTALEHTQPEIAADVIDQGITMTGGGSLLREFATVLQDSTGLAGACRRRSDELRRAGRGTDAGRPGLSRGADRRLEVDLVVVAGRDDDLHPLGEQRPKARPRLHHRVPVLGLLVPAPVERAEIIDHAEMRGGREIGEA